MKANLPFIFVIFFAFFIIFSKYPLFGGYKFYTVSSGSMEPKLHPGSLVIVRPQPKYIIGDMVTYRQSGSNQTVTHRIVEEIKQNQNIYFKTKGDANNAPDTNPVVVENVIGKVIFSLPLIGYPISFSKTMPGLIILIIIPTTIIVFTELQNIQKEILLLYKKYLEKRDKKTD